MSVTALRPFEDYLAGYDGNPWIVPGIVADSGTSWFAQRGAGKTLLAADLAVAMVRDEPEWLGRPLRPGSGPVVFLVTDPKAERELSDRLNQMGAPDGSVLVGRVKRGPDPAEWAELAKDISGARLVVIDSGTNLVHGIVEPEHVNPLNDSMEELVDAGIPVLLLHHMTGSATHKAAGNYLWESWPRWWMYMTKVGNDKDTPYRSLSFEGNQVCDLPATVVARMPRKTHPGSRFAAVDGRNTTPQDRSGERMDKHDGYLLRMLARTDWKSQAEIGEAVGISQKTVSRVLAEKGYRLEDGQVVKVEGVGVGA